MRSRAVVLVLLSLVSVFVVLPNIRMAHAANWNVPITYSNKCVLGNYHQSSSSASLASFGHDISGSNCDGAGYFKTVANAAFGGSSASSANVTFVDSQSFSLPSDGQSSTQLSFSATYYVDAVLGSQGVGLIGAYDGRTTVQDTVSLLQNGALLQNSVVSDRSWSNGCSTGGLSASGTDVFTCPPSGVFLPIHSQYTVKGNYTLYPGNSYALRLSFQSSSTAFAYGDASVWSQACASYDSGLGDNSDCTFHALTNALAPDTQCPAGTYTNPCYYFQWLSSAYSFSDAFSGPKDFSVTPQSFAAPGIDGSAKGVSTFNGEPVGCAATTPYCPTSPLTTSNSNDLVIVAVYHDSGGAVSTISDTAGLVYSKRSSVFVVEEWYAKSYGKLSSDAITVTLSSPAPSDWGIIAFGVSNLDLSSPFDPVGPNKGTNNVCSGYPSITTPKDSNTMIVGIEGNNGLSAPGPDPGFSYITDNEVGAVAAEAETASAATTATISFPSMCMSSPPTWGIIAEVLDGLSAPSAPIYQNGLASRYQMSLVSVNGFSGPISLSNAISTKGSMNPPSVFISPSSVSIPITPPVWVTATLYVSATNSTTPGSYTVTITASGGGNIHITYINVLVARVDPSVVMSLSKSTVYYGVNNVITVNLAESNAGNVAVPSGTVYVQANGNQVGSWITPTSPLSPGQSVTGSISWNVAGLSIGTYNVTAYVPLLPHESLATNRMTTRLDVESCCSAQFSVNGPANTIYVAQGGSGNVPITLSPSYGFTGGVTASGSILSAGLSWDFPPIASRLVNGHATVYVNGTTTSATIAINATSTATLGSYSLSVVISSDLPLSHSVGVNVIVVSPYIQYTWNSNTAFSGINAAVTSSFNVITPANVFSGRLSLTEKNASSGISLLSNSLTVSIPFNNQGVANFVLQSPNAPFWLAAFCSDMINGTSTCNFQRTVDADYDASSVIDIGDLATVSYSFNTAPGSPIWNPKADVTADGRVDIQDVAAVSFYWQWQIFLMTPSIVSLSPNPAFLVFQAGGSNSTSISTSSQNGWSGVATLSSSLVPSGPSCLFGTGTSTNLSVPSRGTASSGLTCSASGTLAPGTYSVTIVGANGGLGNSITFPVDVSGFSMSSPNPSSFSLGSTGASNVTLTSIFGWAGTVTFTTTAPSGVTASCPTVNLAKGAKTTVTCNFSAETGGTYAVTVAGTSGAITQSTSVAVNVKDFAVSANPSSVSLSSKGSSVLVAINLNSLGGFSGNVTLSVTSISSSLCSLWGPGFILPCNNGSASIALTANGSGNATLSIGDLSAQKGTYYVYVAATSGSVSHTVIVTVTIA